MLRPAIPATESESPFSKSVAGVANFAGRGPRRPERSTATTAAMNRHQQPDQESAPGATVTKDVPEQDAPKHKEDNQAHRRSHGETTTQKRE